MNLKSQVKAFLDECNLIYKEEDYTIQEDDEFLITLGKTPGFDIHITGTKEGYLVIYCKATYIYRGLHEDCKNRIIGVTRLGK